ncbi:hypothetical protein [Nocardia lasii]|uniref:Integral membrane protein n=1 Tax=Nocardia lasii TaxID=1616107 RepID=A0ABW1JW19_9NOCA
MIVPPHKPELVPLPEDLVTSRQLWWGVAGLGVVSTVAGLFTMFGRRDEVAEQVVEMYKVDPPLPASTVDLMVVLSFVFAAVIGVLLGGLTVLIAHLMSKGKLWARTVLTVVAVWLSIGALATMFTFADEVGPATIVAGGASIVQGVLAAGAAYLSYRPDSTKYFQSRRR